MLVTTRNKTVTALIEHPAANNRFPYAPAIALGAAMAASIAAGTYPDLQAAGRAMVEVERIVEPRQNLKPIYDDLFERYIGLYETLNPARPSPPIVS